MRELCDELDTAYGTLAETMGLELKTECDPSLVTVESQRTKLVQIAANLLTNALKYTVEGRVHFWVRAVDETHWSLGVEDTGAGMAPQELERLFTEFHRAEKTAHLQGTGLGLAIVKRLVDLLGGEICVHSEVDKGSRFEVIFPRTLALASEASRP
jgi:signal transduction histidine kinase